MPHAGRLQKIDYKRILKEFHSAHARRQRCRLTAQANLFIVPHTRFPED